MAQLNELDGGDITAKSECTIRCPNCDVGTDIKEILTENRCENCKMPMRLLLEFADQP